MVTTNADSTIDYINPVAEELTGWRLEDAMGRPVEEVFRAFHEETCEPLENPLAVAIRRVRPIKSVRPVLLIRRDGNELYVESTAARSAMAQGHVAGGVLVFHDVSESRELNRRLSYHASHDLLTGLVNRREFESRVERALKSAKAREASYALCYLDIDQFKIVNDSCGHSAGDALLGQVGALLKSKVRWRDTLSRLGGDEFGILLESCSLDEAMHTAEQLREAVRTFRFTWEDRVFRLGASVGVVPITAENEDVASILSAADSACRRPRKAVATASTALPKTTSSSCAAGARCSGRRVSTRRWKRAASSCSAWPSSRCSARIRVSTTSCCCACAMRRPDRLAGQFHLRGRALGIAPAIDRWVIENAFRWLVSEADERETLKLCSINLSARVWGMTSSCPS